MSVLVTFVIAAWLVYLHATAKVETEMRSALAVGTRIATNAADDVDAVADASRRLLLLVADFDGDRHLRASVRDASGRVALSSSVAEMREGAPRWFYDLVKGAPRVAIVPLPQPFAGLGTLMLEADARNEATEAWDDALKTFGLLAVLSAIVAGSVWTVFAIALRPLERMAQAIARIGPSLSAIEVPVKAPAEHLRVFAAFNEMVERVRRTEAQNRRLNEQLLTVQEEERADIARDLHDEIGPFLFAVDVEAGSVSRLVGEGNIAGIPEHVGSIREAVSHMQRHVRDILARLRPAALLDLGLADALDNLVKSWQRRQPQIAFALHLGRDGAGLEAEFDEALESSIYRVVQEAISNAVRHASANTIEVAIGIEDGTLEVSVSDDGRGMDGAGRDGTRSEVMTAGGFGIIGMQERVARHGGRLSIASRGAGPGTAVVAHFPLTREAHGDTSGNGRLAPALAATVKERG